MCSRQHKSIWNDFANMSRFILIYGRSKENKDLMPPSLENQNRKNWKKILDAERERERESERATRIFLLLAIRKKDPKIEGKNGLRY